MEIKNKNIVSKIKRNTPYFEDLITRSIYHSNAIEGNTLSFAETYAIVFNQNNLKINALPREIYEAINLKYALNYCFNHINDDISATLIKGIAIKINKNINDIDDFRKTQVYIRGAEHIPPSSYEVPRRLSEIIYNYYNSADDLVRRLAQFHIDFEIIHPFTDGNGRTGRVLIIKELLHNELPPIVIPISLRAEYINYIATYDIEGMSKLIEKLIEAEKSRMNKFGLSVYK